MSLTHATWRVMHPAQIKECVVCDWGVPMQTRETGENNMCDPLSQAEKTVIEI